MFLADMRMLPATILASLVVVASATKPADASKEILIPVRAIGIGYADRVHFPEVRDWRSLRMRFESGICGPVPPCIDTSYDIDGNGNAQMYLERSNVDGKRECETAAATLSLSQLRKLVGDFKRSDFFSLWSEYHRGTSDAPVARFSLAYDQYKKSVVDFSADARDGIFPARWLLDSLNRQAMKFPWSRHHPASCR